MKMTRRQRRIIKLVDKEIDSLHVTYCHVSYDSGDHSPEAHEIRGMQCRMETLRDAALRAFKKQ